MSTLQEIEGHALKLSDVQRARLATHLLQSLPPILVDEGDGLAEAQRRDAELEADASLGLSPEEFRRALLSSRRP